MYFTAEEVLAKHDENYMPPEVQEALDKAHNEGKKKMADNVQATQIVSDKTSETQ